LRFPIGFSKRFEWSEAIERFEQLEPKRGLAGTQSRHGWNNFLAHYFDRLELIISRQAEGICSPNFMTMHLRSGHYFFSKTEFILPREVVVLQEPNQSEIIGIKFLCES